MSTGPKPWPTQSSKPLGDYRVFRVRQDFKISPRTQKPHDFYVIEACSWVTVVAITTSGQLVMVRQYRHGSDTVELEVPGGMIDDGETDPVVAGVRELLEETGYRGTHAELIGRTFPNPAIMNNVCYTVVVTGCEQIAEQDLDAAEDIEIRLVAPADIPRLVAEGFIGHALAVVALYNYEQWLKRR